MYGDWDNGFWDGGIPINPAHPVLVGTGFDRTSYISTAQLAPSPYTSQALIQAKIGGLIRLIEACDDQNPPSGDINDPQVKTIYNAVVQNVTTEINGYLSSIYPTPLAQTGTVAVVQVTGVTTDGLGTVTSIQVIDGGNYCTAPAVSQVPQYLRYLDPLVTAKYFPNWQTCQTGKGLQLTAAYQNQNYSDESGQVLQALTLNGVPVIVNGGTGYQQGDLLVLTGGTSFVPGKVRQAALVLCCHSFYQRRVAPDEKNVFDSEAKMFREALKKIAEGDEVLDGTYKRYFSPGAMIGNKSIFYGSNSL